MASRKRQRPELRRGGINHRGHSEWGVKVVSEDDVLLVEGQLGVELPEVYRSWLITLPDSFSDAVSARIWKELGRIYIRPEEIIDYSRLLMGTSWLQDTEWSGTDVSDFVVIGDDVCGNYYVLDPDDSDPEVQYLIHDPEGLEELFPTLDAFCKNIDKFL
ncbi:SMI1/KNR4 family protein [Aeoliella sp.]|uniref:SMI1/KNR4 family protein n=1 Tax=Aeoliella sp. TaxID=2795800 RepID=UPI003CCC1C1D